VAQQSGTNTYQPVIQDRLGSVGKYYPYGEERNSPQLPNDQVKFATYTRDSATGNDYADQRYYTSVLGRFMTADPYSPAPDGAAKLTEPGTWNHYSYTAGEPINRADPSGQSFCDPEALLDPGCFTAGGSFGTVNPLWASFLTNLAAQIAAQIKAAAAALQAQPEQCDITLMGASAVIPGDPALHLWLQITVSDPNTGFSQTGVLEANAVSKSDPTQPATKWQLLTGQAWLNGGFSTTPLKGSGQMIYNFDQEYSNDALCAFVTLLGIDSGAYKNNTVTYNPLSPNSNSYIAYMLSEAGIQLPAGIAFELFFIAPGFYGVMPSNP
jgi:RHS repeat-associated protein